MKSSSSRSWPRRKRKPRRTRPAHDLARPPAAGADRSKEKRQGLVRKRREQRRKMRLASRALIRAACVFPVGSAASSRPANQAAARNEVGWVDSDNFSGPDTLANRSRNLIHSAAWFSERFWHPSRFFESADAKQNFSCILEISLKKMSKNVLQVAQKICLSGINQVFNRFNRNKEQYHFIG